MPPPHAEGEAMRVPIARTENDPATFLTVLREMEQRPYRDPKGRFKPQPKPDDDGDSR